MELLYMWIGHYANIYHKGFNFSNKYHFISSDTTIEISNKTTDSIKLFNDSFINVVAIAGENGSGKTSLLSFVENFFLKDDFRMHKDVKLVYKDNEGVLKVYGVERDDISCSADITFEPINDLTELKANVLPLFFSSGIEIRNEPQLRSSFIEVTGEKLLRDKQKEVNKILIEQTESIFKTYNWPNVSEENTDKFEQDKRLLLNWSNAAPTYRNDDLKRIIHFICKHNPDEYKFIPNWLEIGLNFNFYDKYRELYIGEEVFFEKIERLIYSPTILPPYDQEKYRKHFKEAIICELFLFLFICSKRMVTFHEFDIDDLLTNLKAKETTEELIDEIKTRIVGANFSSSGYLIHFDKVKELVEKLDEYINVINIYNYFNGKFTLDRNNNTLLFLNAFYDFWNLSEFAFLYRWSEMSAGEKALLTLLSRLFSIPEYSNINESNTVWLFIDEGELYLHPEWQRNFFSDIHRYLPKFFPNNKVQLFLTTHSPFILSDLPKANVLLLQKGESGTGCQVTDMEAIPQTFGANIHELLSNSFFMSSSTGDFAVEKINDVIKYIKDEQQNALENDDDVQKLIDIIGEPIIKNKLQTMLNQKRSKEELLNYYREQISRLETE